MSLIHVEKAPQVLYVPTFVSQLTGAPHMGYLETAYPNKKNAIAFANEVKKASTYVIMTFVCSAMIESVPEYVELQPEPITPLTPFITNEEDNTNY